jgi:hypothetical protein
MKKKKGTNIEISFVKNEKANKNVVYQRIFYIE